jgi:hypothetical protein
VTRALLLAVIVLVVGGCGDNKSAATTATTPTTTNPTGTAAKHFQYPAALTKSYMQSCLKSPRITRAYCACTLDKLSENVPTSDFQRVGLSGGQIPPLMRARITQAARACRNKL